MESDKVVVLFGARQTGKTTLINRLTEKLSLKILAINADELRYLDILSSRDVSKMKLLVEGYDILYIDEAQRIPDAGINLKILYDNFPGLKIILTGSSSLELASKTKEALTGRTISYNLYPLSWQELEDQYKLVEMESRLEEFLIYGSYPDIVTTPGASMKQRKLRELTSSYLYKDILELTSIRNSRKIADLLRLIAFQAGSQVSTTELASSLQMSKETVASYIDLLEKSFVLFRLQGFSRNLRKEVTKMDKLFFFDLGIRNALINNFNPLYLRQDSGQLWENYMLIERLKYLSNNDITANLFFWRTYSGTEIDLIEEKEGSLYAYEFKYGTKISKEPSPWAKAYPGSSFKTINTKNFRSLIS
jgi:predicted AAA+ superfamily ATPase